MKSFEFGTRKTVLLYLHGLRGHGYAQKSVLRHMSRTLNVSVVSLELPGHGKDSFKEHCMVPEYRRLVELIKNEVGRRAGRAEQVILMGYSFGAGLMTLVADALDKDPDFAPKVAGLIGVSAAFDVAHNVPKWQLTLANVIAPLSRFLYRHIPKWSRYITIREMDISLISPELSVQESIRHDELVYKGRIPLNTSAQVYKTSVAALSTLNTLSVPVLLVHSADDPIALAPKADDLAPHVRLKLFTNLRHNCIDGVSREVVMSRREITEFIVKKL